MALLADTVETWRRVSATRSRLAKVRALTEWLVRLAPPEIEIGVTWLAGETRQGRIGIGHSALQAARQASATTVPVLTLTQVDAQLASIAAQRGAGSTARRTQALRDLFAAATPAEQAFLARLLLGELRQGALAALMLEAVAAAARIPFEEVRRASMYAPGIGRLAHIALQEGSAGLAAFQLEVLSPIAPMLAQTAGDAARALEQLGGEAAFEWKLDGARVQVHKAGEVVRVYTRGLNDVTTAVPEVVETVAAFAARELVLDGETIVLDACGRPRPFQVTMRRFGRRLDVEALRVELPLSVYFFDCLRLGPVSLVDRPARERFTALERAVPARCIVPRRVIRDAGEGEAFMADALAHGHEGVMVKSLDVPYEAGNRGAGWLKVKRAHTLDLVVLAAEWGSGRRTGWLSNLHLGARDPDSGGYVMLGKTFKGLTDAMLEWQTAELLARETRRERHVVHVRPELVVEVAFNDIQASPRYPGGLALRFARVKAYRSDKRPEEADTLAAVRALYCAQSGQETAL